MINIPLSTIAKWTNGLLNGIDEIVKGVSVDTRTLKPDELFVALRGEHFDGHVFVERACELGAKACLLERPCATFIPHIIVSNTERALGDMARKFRATQQTTVIGITGSNGKTTVKNMLASILSMVASTHVNAGNFNNEIGLPLTLLSMPEGSRYAVLEMGAGKPGDIGYLTSIAQPSIGLVNNVAPAHLLGMGNLEGVAETKGAIYSTLPPHGVAIINADDAFAAYFTEISKGFRTITFGFNPSAEVTATIQKLGENSQFTLRSPAGEISISLPLMGRHNVQNALASSAAALALDIPLTAIKAGLEKVLATQGRLISHRTPNGWTIIDDAYNANPGSLTAAIHTLASIQTDMNQTWLVLGDMKELGNDAERFHYEVGCLAKQQGIGRLFTVGDLSYLASKAFGENAQHFAEQADLIKTLKSNLHKGVHCLIKGSRSSAMDKVVIELLKDDKISTKGAGYYAA